MRDGETIRPSDYFTLDPQRDNHEKYLKGRSETLTEALESIIAPGQNVSFHGEPGVGKTSVARALFRIASGATVVAEELGVDVPDYHEPLACVWFECMEQDTSLEDVLSRLLREKYNFLKEKFPETMIKRDYLEVLDEQGVAIAFSYLAEGLKQEYHDRQLLVFLDDVDRLSSTPAISSIIKLRGIISFVLCGVSTALRDLISDYQPNSKHFDQFVVEFLPEEEVYNLFNLIGQASDGAVSYSQEFIREVWTLSCGHPLILQNLGYFSLAPKGIKAGSVIGIEGLKGGSARLLKKEQATHLREETDGLPGRKSALSLLASKQYGFVSGNLLAEHDDAEPGLLEIFNDLCDTKPPILCKKGGKYRFSDCYYRAAAALMFKELSGVK